MFATAVAILRRQVMFTGFLRAEWLLFAYRSALKADQGGGGRDDPSEVGPDPSEEVCEAERPVAFFHVGHRENETLVVLRERDPLDAGSDGFERCEVGENVRLVSAVQPECLEQSTGDLVVRIKRVADLWCDQHEAHEYAQRCEQSVDGVT